MKYLIFSFLRLTRNALKNSLENGKRSILKLSHILILRYVYKIYKYFISPNENQTHNLHLQSHFTPLRHDWPLKRYLPQLKTELSLLKPYPQQPDRGDISPRRTTSASLISAAIFPSPQRRPPQLNTYVRLCDSCLACDDTVFIKSGNLYTFMV